MKLGPVDPVSLGLNTAQATGTLQFEVSGGAKVGYRASGVSPQAIAGRYKLHLFRGPLTAAMSCNTTNRLCVPFLGAGSSLNRRRRKSLEAIPIILVLLYSFDDPVIASCCPLSLSDFRSPLFIFTC